MTPANLEQVLKLSLGFRSQGDWPKANQLVGFWIDATRAARSGFENRIGTEAPAATNRDEKSIHNLMVLSEYAEQNSDSALAIAAYRRLLRFDPTQHVVCNNLAYAIYRQPHSLEEALRLTERALAAKPECEEYRKTMQSIQRMRDERSATENFPSTQSQASMERIDVSQ